MNSRLGLASLLVAILASAALSGCISDDAAPGDTAPQGVEQPAPLLNTTWYFDDEFSMTETAPTGDAGRAPLGTFYTRWFQGYGFPEWIADGPNRTVHITGTATLTFWITTDTFVPSTPGIFPDFVVYFGSTESMLSVVSPNNLRPVVADNTIVMAGDAIQVEAEFELPPGGMVIPAESNLRIMTAPVMMETEQANELYILYGSNEYPSGVSFTYQALEGTPYDANRFAVHDASHELLAGTFLHGQEIEGTNILTVPFDVVVDNATHGIHVNLDYTGDPGFPDMDLYLFAPDGTPMGLSVTPGANEAVHLYKPNLEAGGSGTWTAKVINYVTVKATFDLFIGILADGSQAPVPEPIAVPPPEPVVP